MGERRAKADAMVFEPMLKDEEDYGDEVERLKARPGFRKNRFLDLGEMPAATNRAELALDPLPAGLDRGEKVVDMFVPDAMREHRKTAATVDNFQPRTNYSMLRLDSISSRSSATTPVLHRRRPNTSIIPVLVGAEDKPTAVQPLCVLPTASSIRRRRLNRRRPVPTPGTPIDGECNFCGAHNMVLVPRCDFCGRVQAHHQPGGCLMKEFVRQMLRQFPRLSAKQVMKHVMEFTQSDPFAFRHVPRDQLFAEWNRRLQKKYKSERERRELAGEYLSDDEDDEHAHLRMAGDDDEVWATGSIALWEVGVNVDGDKPGSRPDTRGSVTNVYSTLETLREDTAASIFADLVAAKDPAARQQLLARFMALTPPDILLEILRQVLAVDKVKALVSRHLDVEGSHTDRLIRALLNRGLEDWEARTCCGCPCHKKDGSGSDSSAGSGFDGSGGDDDEEDDGEDGDGLGLLDADGRPLTVPEDAVISDMGHRRDGGGRLSVKHVFRAQRPATDGVFGDDDGGGGGESDEADRGGARRTRSGRSSRNSSAGEDDDADPAKPGGGGGGGGKRMSLTGGSRSAPGMTSPARSGGGRALKGRRTSKGGRHSRRTSRSGSGGEGSSGSSGSSGSEGDGSRHRASGGGGRGRRGRDAHGRLPDDPEYDPATAGEGDGPAKGKGKGKGKGAHGERGGGGGGSDSDLSSTPSWLSSDNSDDEPAAGGSRVHGKAAMRVRGVHSLQSDPQQQQEEEAEAGGQTDGSSSESDGTATDAAAVERRRQRRRRRKRRERRERRARGEDVSPSASGSDLSASSSSASDGEAVGEEAQRRRRERRERRLKRQRRRKGSSSRPGSRSGSVGGSGGSDGSGGEGGEGGHGRGRRRGRGRGRKHGGGHGGDDDEEEEEDEHGEHGHGRGRGRKTRGGRHHDGDSGGDDAAEGHHGRRRRRHRRGDGGDGTDGTDSSSGSDGGTDGGTDDGGGGSRARRRKLATADDDEAQGTPRLDPTNESRGQGKTTKAVGPKGQRKKLIDFTVPPYWSRVLKKKKKGKVMTTRQAWDLTLNIYDDSFKVRGDAQGGDFAATVTEVLMIQVGARKLVEAKLSSLVASMRKYAAKDPWVYLFAQFCGITEPRSLAALAFFLSTLHRVRQESAVQPRALTSGKPRHILQLLHLNKAVHVAEGVVRALAGDVRAVGAALRAKRTDYHQAKSARGVSNTLPCVDLQDVMLYLVQAWDVFETAQNHRLQTLFSAADADNSGTIDAPEMIVLFSTVKRLAADGASVNIPDLVAALMEVSESAETTAAAAAAADSEIADFVTDAMQQVGHGLDDELSREEFIQMFFSNRQLQHLIGVQQLLHDVDSDSEGDSDADRRASVFSNSGAARARRGSVLALSAAELSAAAASSSTAGAGAGAPSGGASGGEPTDGEEDETGNESDE